ncbi:hypothetical protein trd_1898 [Thermomicrobium roseum DSM 5159]|uniref:Uncharacterized protein n=1 Tax=Thermomicrobium roseum (strain ATCC 27502 / DSM 5159 / P-2) TaxID=309801 RepID=B9L1Z8_THERP|nr:hypothetical protein trd_1898 [Thermomicrobium roseum DSM 5159]
MPGHRHDSPAPMGANAAEAERFGQVSDQIPGHRYYPPPSRQR